MAFTEITAVVDTDEIMLDIDEETGKVIMLYVYNDAQIEYYSKKLDDYKLLITNSWKSQRNPMLLHCPKSRIGKVLKILECQIMFSSVDLEENFDLINKMVKKYDLDINTSF